MAKKGKSMAQSVLSAPKRAGMAIWHSGIAASVSAVVLLYLVYLHFSNSPVPSLLAGLCASLILKIVVVALLVLAVIHGDVLSAVLIFAAFYGLCYLSGRSPWEFMENKGAPAVGSNPPPVNPTGAIHPGAPTGAAPTKDNKKDNLVKVYPGGGPSLANNQQ